MRRFLHGEQSHQVALFDLRGGEIMREEEMTDMGLEVAEQFHQRLRAVNAGPLRPVSGTIG